MSSDRNASIGKRASTLVGTTPFSRATLAETVPFPRLGEARAATSDTRVAHTRELAIPALDERSLVVTGEASLATTGEALATTSEALAATIPFERSRELTTGESFGPYVVYEKLGEGGMAYVHRAELVGEGGLRKEVALKRLQTHAAQDPEFVDMFVHEAQLAAKLRHPNIAQAFDLGKIDGTYYIAMELVSGPTLAQVIMQSAEGGAGAVPLPIALEILIQLCDALDHAHDMRDDTGRPLDLVHRDVSPMNVIISKTGIVKLIDFGIAKDRSARRQTETGIIKGKHAYLAPEYTYGQLDRRADLFGLGVVAHELLTGRRLFAGKSDADTIRNLRSMIVPPPSRYGASISPALDDIVLKALERDPDQRWQNAGEMRAALTEERRRLGVAVTGRQIRDWAEWAFQQVPRRDSSVDRALAACDPSLSVSIEIECPPVRRAQTVLGNGVTEPIPADEMPAPMHPDDMPTVDGAKPIATLLALSHDDVPTVDMSPAAPIIVRTKSKPAASARPRAPRWRAPTRWMKPRKRRSLAPFVLLALVGLGAFLVLAGVVDLERLRDLFASHAG